MNTATLTAALPRTRRRFSPPRLMSAELLKLRKRRGLVISALVLTILPMLIAYAVLLGQEGTAGGVANFAGSLDVLAGLSVVAAVLVGATLGTGDLSAGVFRELVVTGRSRFALFAARVPAGLALLLPIVGTAFAITAVASIAFAGSQEAGVNHGVLELGDVAPGAGLLAHSAVWLALVTAVSMVLALGISSLVGSRGTSIGILLGWYFAVMPVLLSMGPLGSLREGLFYAAAERLMPSAVLEGGNPTVPMSLAAAVAVMLAWAMVPLALGAWRTCTRDA